MPWIQARREDTRKCAKRIARQATLLLETISSSITLVAATAGFAARPSGCAPITRGGANVEHDKLPIVERVARAMVGRQLGKAPADVSDKAWMLYTGRAKAALEASHHAELVEALTAIRDSHLIGSPLDKSAWETMARSQRQIARALLAKLDGKDTK
jgi:hypothetical protein